MIIRRIMVALVLLAVTSSASAVLDIVVSFDDNAYVWTNVQKAVVNQAITDWEDAFSAYVLDETVSFGIDFRNTGAAAVTYGWDVGWAYLGTGFSSRPWLNTGHYMGIQPGVMWWDPTPAIDGDGIYGYDALTLIRHELGHMLGSQPGLYFDNIYTGNQTDVWEDQIVGNTFDPGGLNVSMASGDHGHTNGGLMNAYLYTGQRFEVDQTMAMMALAFDLTPVPEPMTMSLLAIGGVAVLIKRRRSA